MYLCIPPPEKPSYAYQMVRTDSREQKLDAFVVPKSLQLREEGASSRLGQSQVMESCTLEREGVGVGGGGGGGGVGAERSRIGKGCSEGESQSHSGSVEEMDLEEGTGANPAAPTGEVQPAIKSSIGGYDCIHVHCMLNTITQLLGEHLLVAIDKRKQPKT